MKTKVTNEFISQLTREWVATLPYRYPLDRENPHQFSQRFLDRMEPVLQRAMKTTATLLAAALGATVAMAYVAHYFQMVRYDHEKYSFVRYQEVGTGDRSAEFVPYHITYVPDGFSQVQSRLTELSYQEKYENEEGLVISFYQKRIEKASFFIDTENIESQEILLNEGQPAFFMKYENYKSIYWHDGEYLFLVSGDLNKDCLVKIAESVVKQ